MARNIDTTLVRTFVAVADSATITGAANALHLTQGAVSQHVKRLEDALGCRLFERERRGLRLTGAGERLFGKAKRLLSMNDEIWAEMTAKVLEGPVRLGAPPDLVGTRLAPALKAFADAHPKVEMALLCAPSPELARLLATGKLDLALMEQPAPLATGECLSIEPLVWVGARGGTAHLKRPLPLSMVSDTCAFRGAVLAALRQHGLPWKTVFENGSMEATLATVRADLAVSAWLASTVPRGLQLLPPGAGLPHLPPFAITLHEPPHPAGAAEALAHHIRTGLAQHAAAPNPYDGNAATS